MKSCSSAKSSMFTVTSQAINDLSIYNVPSKYGNKQMAQCRHNSQTCFNHFFPSNQPSYNRFIYLTAVLSRRQSTHIAYKRRQTDTFGNCNVTAYYHQKSGLLPQ